MKIMIDIEDYITLLNERRVTVEKLFKPIPDKVWDLFITKLECGYFPKDTSPRYVVDNLATNASFGPIENFWQDDTLKHLESEGTLESEISYCLDIDEIQAYYEDPTSDYGFGIVSSWFV
jgi:hypothetical protein